MSRGRIYRIEFKEKKEVMKIVGRKKEVGRSSGRGKSSRNGSGSGRSPITNHDIFGYQS
jgi:hypothetical protein